MTPDLATESDAGVLLVDDRPENLLALQAVLAPLGCRTVAVTSGEEALKALLQGEFAVVLLDVQMPGMDGFETAELIKARKRTRAVPIIFVTAISKERHHVFRGYEAGAVDYLFKPYDPELLKSKVRVFLELDAKSRAAARAAALAEAAFASAPIGMARIDLEGRVAEANRALGALLGREPAELRDRVFASLLHSDDRPAEGAEPTEHSARLLALDGEAIPCRLTYAVAHPGHGLPPALVVGVQDLRERRRLELEREQRIREQVARAEAERASAMLRGLQAISDVAIGVVPIDQLVGDLLFRTAEALGADTASAALFETDGRSFVHQVVTGDSDGGAGRWYTVVAAPSGDESKDALPEGIGAPLAVGDVIIGELRVGSLFGRRFDRDDQDLLRLAADRAALAIQRARAQQRDRAITEELQRSLLPAALPSIEGAAAAARYRPGVGGERVGGDWYDVVIQPNGRVLLVIGDVAGHGVEAAAEMGQLRSALRAYALDGHGPAALLARLNTFQVEMPGPGMTTVALVSVDLAAGAAVYACAGHPPPLLVGARGATRWLDEALGPPLGAVDGIRYRDAQAAIVPGGLVVLYTDGLVELRTEKVDVGLERLRSAVKRAPRDVEPLCDHLVEHTLADADAAEDDVTLLVLRAIGERRRRGGDRRRPKPAVDGLAMLSSGTWPHQPLRAARVELARGERAGGAARRILRETLEDFVTPQQLSDLRSVASEIVNNAIVHGDDDGKPLVVHCAATAGLVRVEVAGSGAPFTPPKPSPVDEPGGFGLGIVEELSSRWGIDFASGVCVWFELDRAT